MSDARLNPLHLNTSSFHYVEAGGLTGASAGGDAGHLMLKLSAGGGSLEGPGGCGRHGMALVRRTPEQGAASDVWPTCALQSFADKGTLYGLTKNSSTS